ncbi:phosphodiester glycosidase family protein [Paenibacillus sp. IB182496]|uniref:Phosphodiester glycosidase family protein n=1 Tax=Paenibacillus sabuli TaxID=2772509 RepID=A0A927BUQ7_9BACL|nr:stalk domain-containing protein [Paenibacillus sabuli]MBD2845844.1 phosphodiester glycosidase family protein [Paenibacillus sabuli]
MRTYKKSTNVIDHYRRVRSVRALLRRRVLVAALSGALLVQPLAAVLPGGAPGVAAAASQSALASQGLSLVREEMVTSGAKRYDYTWRGTRSGSSVRANVHVLEVDLTDPYVELDVMSGHGGAAIASREAITGMVQSTGAVAGINADYFSTSAEGVPMGPQIHGGALMTSPSMLKGMYAFALDQNRKPVIDQFGFEGQIIAADGSVFPLTGINQTSYSMELESGNQLSHVNAMYIYTDAWKSSERPNTANSGTTPTEVLVQNGIVMQISDKASLPVGPPADGYILRTHGDAAQFVRDHLTVGSAIQADYNLVSLTTGAPKSVSAYQMMVGGHTILVEEGKAAAYSRDVSNISGSSATSRTAIGYSRDGSTVYMITVEKYGDSSGMTLNELQQTMTALGVWKGLNLDGGGSTTMVDRPLGHFNTGLAHNTQNSGGTEQRRVVNGIGVYTNAPQGQVKGITVSGQNVLFVGQQAEYSVKAYDTYYNPVDPGAMNAKWQLGKPLGKLAGSTLTATKPGTTKIQASAGSAAGHTMLEIIGPEQIVQMSVTAASDALKDGAVLDVTVQATLDDGRVLRVPAESLDWELRGFTGTVAGDKLQVKKVNAGANAGYAIARYQGYPAVAVFAIGDAVSQKMWADFEQNDYGVSFKPLPAQTKGTASVVKGEVNGKASSILRIAYDFTAGSGSKFAYAELGKGGIAVEGQPLAIEADVLGDDSGNWLRMEIEDAGGKTHYIQLAQPVDWTGWRHVTADLQGMGIAYPMTVKRIYVANPENGQETRAATGAVALDNIRLTYPAALVQPDLPRIELVAGSRSATIGGAKTQLEVAPLILNGTTYLPLRFVADVVQGQVAWDNEAKRATFIRGGKMMDVWLGSYDYVLNGARLSGEVKPILRNGRTLVPLRLVSEQLGVTIGWENATKKITIQ